MHWRDTSKAQCKQAQDCSIYRCTKDKLGLSISPLDIAFLIHYFFVLFSLFFDFLIYNTQLLVTRPTQIAKHHNLMSSPSSGKTSLLGKFLVTYEKGCVYGSERSKLDAMCTRSNTKNEDKRTQNVTVKNGPDYPGHEGRIFRAGLSGAQRPDYPGWRRGKTDLEN